MKWIPVFLFTLAACASPTPLPTATESTGSADRLAQPTPAHTGAMSGSGTVVPSAPAETDARGAHSYEGDRANSITIAAGECATIHQPDYADDYTVCITAISATGITVASDNPHVEIRDNGERMVSFFDTREPNKLGYDVPIGWARFTPLEHTPVVQTYSMQPGGTVVREGDEN